MVDLPPNWDQLESEYNRHYDPYATTCPECGREDCEEEFMDEDGDFQTKCSVCGYIYE